MPFGYAQPFSFQIKPQSSAQQQPAIESVRQGVTEIVLSDGRTVRATLKVNSLKADPKDPNKIDVSYNLVAEVVKAPVQETPARHVNAPHETLQ